jgi:glutamate/tyrosine decarboxylase-like PLP-dependent enzyme
MHSQASPPEQAFSLPSALAQIQSALNSSSPPGASSNPALPPPSTIAEAASKIHTSLPAHGLGSAATLSHILDDLSPGFNGSKTSPHYYGFVTGGVLPVAEAADHVVTRWDQNVQAHLAHHGVATSIEWRAGGLLCDLQGLAGAADGPAWRGRAFTTGATASNVLGLACGREAVLGWKMRACGASVRARGERVLGSRRGREADVGGEGVGVGDLGLLEACRRAGVEGFQVLTTMGHSSLSKAASIVGLGRSSVKDVGMEAEPWKFDMQRLEEMLSRHGTASIVAVSCGEVNTGRYATSGLEEMRRLRELCDRFGAWLHVDGGESSLLPFGELGDFG